MLHRFVTVLALAAGVMLPVFGPRPEPAAAQVGCSFQLGFQVLHDMIPDIVGTCRENEWHNAFNGDGLQQTTGGLMVWRKADNWTAFTNGSITWINGPFGLQSRLNTERFAWEGSAPVPSAAQPGGSEPAPAAAAVTSSAAPSMSLDLSDNRIDQGQTTTIRLEANSDVGVDSIWWWATSTDDNDLRDTHTANCRGASPCRRSWDVSTTDTGTITIHAMARDTNGTESAEATEELRVREVTPTPTPSATAAPTATPKP